MHARWGKMCASRDLLQAAARNATSWKLLYAEKAATHKRYAPWLMACDSEVRAMVDVILMHGVGGGSGGNGSGWGFVVDDGGGGLGGLGMMSCYNRGAGVGMIQQQEEHRDLFNVWTGRSVMHPQSSSSSLISSSSALTSSSSSSSAITGQDGHSPPRHLWTTTTTTPGSSSSAFSAATSTSTLSSSSLPSTSSPRSIMYCDPSTNTAVKGGRKRERRRKTSVVLLFDASSSVTDEDFKTMKAFTKRLIAGLCPTGEGNIKKVEERADEGENEKEGRKCDGKIGLIQFNQHPRVELQLTQSNKPKVIRSIESMTQLMGSTDIAAPIRRAREMLSEATVDNDSDSDDDSEDDIGTNGEYYTSRGLVGMPRTTGMMNNNNTYHRFDSAAAGHHSSSMNNKRRKKNKSRKIIVLMTDGQTHADELRESERETQRAVDELDVTMYTIGVGRDIDEKGLTRIAKVSRLGAYFTLRRFVHSK